MKKKTYVERKMYLALLGYTEFINLARDLGLQSKKEETRFHNHLTKLKTRFGFDNIYWEQVKKTGEAK